ncbi:hypothetical protein AXF42_Ash012376 [Apostasia shenzhenica]|uniref:CCHC-type domain-containing protein n=1 Tax=Apostasia shenzhenica TaxID=1088818 RepID=A0A2I0AD11_9ASPA|nr:hypothetical protein AXF42_Ash012376 [Apostasia shenzhenica]
MQAAQTMAQVQATMQAPVPLPSPPSVASVQVGEPHLDRLVELFQRMHPQHFEGTTDTVIAEKWVGMMEKVFEGIRCPADRKVSLAATAMDGAADDWWRDHCRIFMSGRAIETITWEEFLEAFRLKYIPISAQEKMREELSRLVQRNMIVPEYEAKLAALAKFVPQMIPDEAEKCYLFRKGLRDSVPVAVIPAHTKVYAELVEMATLVEQDQLATQARKEAVGKRKGMASKSILGPVSKKSASSSSRVGDSGGNFGKPKCQHCGKFHWGTCRLESKLEGKNCFVCGEFSHIAKACPKRATPVSGAIVPTSVASTFGGRGGGTSATFRRGRRSATVIGGQGPQPRVHALTQKEAQESLDVITGTIYLCDLPMVALFDSGVSHSFISKNIVRRLSLKVHPLDDVLNVALPTGAMIGVKWGVNEVIKITDHNFQSKPL